MTDMMRALRLHAKMKGDAFKFGVESGAESGNHPGVEQLSVDEVPVPAVQPGETLVRVMATGITRNELSGTPTLTNEDGSSRLPPIPGHEVAGIVEVVSGPMGSKAVGLAAHPPG